MRNYEYARAIVAPETYSKPKAYHSLFDTLRNEDPLTWVEPEGYRPFWIVSKYNDVVEIERQDEIFLNSPRLNLVPIVEEDRVRSGTGQGSTNPLRMIINMDGPAHRSYRELTQSWFMPSNLRKFQVGLGELAKEFIDRMEQMGGRCDFAKDIGVWFPLRAIMMILGVPREDDHKMLTWTKAAVASYDTEMSEGAFGVEARQRAILGFFEYFAKLSEDRRRQPTDDLATIIANASIESASIPQFEAMSYYFIIATAGHDTTSSTATGGLLALIEHPDQLAKLRANPELLPSAIEEMLRWVSPVTHFFRTATCDFELRGRQIKAGQSLMMCYPSANRDDEVFPEPHVFKIDRKPNRQIAFGVGAHSCLGMNLARMELKALFTELLARVKTIELAGDPALIEALHLVALKRLPVRFEMA